MKLLNPITLNEKILKGLRHLHLHSTFTNCIMCAYFAYVTSSIPLIDDGHTSPQ